MMQKLEHNIWKYQHDHEQPQCTAETISLHVKFNVMNTLRAVVHILSHWHFSWNMIIQNEKKFSISVKEALEIQDWLEVLCHNFTKLLTDLKSQDDLKSQNEINESLQPIYQKKNDLLSIMQEFVTKDCKLLDDDLGDDWVFVE